MSSAVVAQTPSCPRITDILALLVFGHADVDDPPPRQPVCDKLGAAPLALLDERRIMIGHCLVERQGRCDAVLIQHGENAKNPDAVAVTADIGELGLVASPHPLGAAQRAHRYPVCRTAPPNPNAPG